MQRNAHKKNDTRLTTIIQDKRLILNISLQKIYWEERSLRLPSIYQHLLLEKLILHTPEFVPRIDLFNYVFERDLGDNTEPSSLDKLGPVLRRLRIYLAGIDSDLEGAVKTQWNVGTALVGSVLPQRLKGRP